MKIGLILAQHNEIEYIQECLTPWIKYRKDNSLLIACLDALFQESLDVNSDGSSNTHEILTEYKRLNLIDFYQKIDQRIKEHEVRNIALKWLLENDIEVAISIGVDEIFTLEEIEKITNYIKKERFIAVFKIHYKNYIGDKKHYINGFVPHRIWRVQYQDNKLKEFAWDDDIKYIDKNGLEILDKMLPSKIIPGIQIKHYTWLNDERSRRKCIYQNDHFSPYGCGYKWNETTKSVGFNEEYYKKTGQSIPEIMVDNV